MEPLEPGVSAAGLQPENWVTYADFTRIANSLRSSPVSWPLPPPKQGSNGDCWLLTAAVGLQCFYPRFVVDMVDLGSDGATIKFPRHGTVDVNYVLPVHSSECTVVVHVETPRDLFWALLEKAVCVVLHREYNARTHERRRRKGLAHTSRKPHYVDLHGGLVSAALNMLSPAKPSAPCTADLFSIETKRRLGNTGLFFLEVPRHGGWHSMLLLAATETEYIAYDPWGFYVYDYCALGAVHWEDVIDVHGSVARKLNRGTVRAQVYHVDHEARVETLESHSSRK